MYTENVWYLFSVKKEVKQKFVQMSLNNENGNDEKKLTDIAERVRLSSSTSSCSLT